MLSSTWGRHDTEELVMGGSRDGRGALWRPAR
ncbi:hypothetical protein SFR_6767 [Streptomyces sp. FR-008]|nr:hypothetical protein SFR_6767 [Streptomyces sp. FR-008]